MRVFISDIKRAILSWKTLISVALMMTVLFLQGFDSDLFRISVPVICTLPFSGCLLTEYQSSFTKYAVYRCGKLPYILSKFLCCTTVGGGALTLCAWIYVLIQNDEKITCAYDLLMLSGMVWAGVSTTLATLSNSRYIAYGGSFIVYYFLVILQERYFASLEFLNPCVWFETTDICFSVILQCVLYLVVLCAYFAVLRGKLRNV